MWWTESSRWERTLALALALCPVGAGRAQARADETCPVDRPIGAAELPALSDALWARRGALRQQAARDGWQAAREASPGHLRGFNAELTPELALGDGPGEYAGAATLVFELGAGVRARRAALDAEWRATAAAFDQARWQQGEALRAAYLDWRVRAFEQAHLTAYVAEADAELGPIRDAAAQRLISQLDVADLEAELARIRHELNGATRLTVEARARFEALTGARCALAVIPPHDPEAESAAHGAPADAGNPWTALIARAEAFPAVGAHTARAQALTARAAAHDAADPWTVELGAGLRAVGGSQTFAGPIVRLSVPLGRSEGADAETARAAARAEALAAAETTRRIRAALAAEEATFDARVTSGAVMRRELLAPLAARAEQVQAAARVGQAPIERLIRARRELHEAEHALILLDAELDAHRLAAAAVEALLDARPSTASTPEESP